MEYANVYGFDLELSQNATIRLVTGEEETQQRIIRRLLTPPGSYVFHPDYGAGLGGYVGENLSGALERQLKGLIIRQMFLEESVARSPFPKILLKPTGNGLEISITYASRNTEQVYTLSFTVTE